jgi:poly-D-alanine transfer protein DltD
MKINKRLAGLEMDMQDELFKHPTYVPIIGLGLCSSFDTGHQVLRVEFCQNDETGFSIGDFGPFSLHIHTP